VTTVRTYGQLHSSRNRAVAKLALAGNFVERKLGIPTDGSVGDTNHRQNTEGMLYA